MATDKKKFTSPTIVKPANVAYAPAKTITSPASMAISISNSCFSVDRAT